MVILEHADDQLSWSKKKTHLQGYLQGIREKEIPFIS